MDTSKGYIDMCSKAFKLQALKIPIWGFCRFQQGDIFSKDGKIYMYASEEQQPRTEGVVWLPTQDQLQEQVWGWIDDVRFSIPSEGKITFETFNQEITTDSFEKAWLMIYMREQNNRLWTTKEEDETVYHWEDRG